MAKLTEVINSFICTGLPSSTSRLHGYNPNTAQLIVTIARNYGMLINISNSYTIPITSLSEETGRPDVLPASRKLLTELSEEPINFVSATHIWQGSC